MNIIILGPPGSGKGTQANILVTSQSMIQLSTGDMLRKARSSGSVLGRKVAAIMDAGELVTDEIVIAMIAESLNKGSSANFIFDGFPRTLKQADALDDLLEKVGQPISLAIELTVDPEILVERITGRISCSNCGAVFHKSTNPPLEPGICNNCGGSLHQRPDDNEEALRTRLLEYYRLTSPLTGYYHHAGVLRQVSSEGDIDAISERIAELVTQI